MYLKIMSGIVILCLSAPILADEIEERYRQAGHPATTAAMLLELSFDQDSSIRERIASNRRTPAAVLLRLANDPNTSVKISLATNLSAPDGIYPILARDAALAVRSVVARFEYVPVTALTILAKDKDVDIRLEVARNLNTTRSILSQLMLDDNDRVKAIATQALQRLSEEEAGGN